MKRKIYVLVMTLVLCMTSLTFVFNEPEVNAAEGSGGNEFKGEDIGLNYAFMLSLSDNLSKVVHNEFVYDDTEIPKGRAWGTDGDRHTATEILEPRMKDDCGLNDVGNMTIGFLWSHPNRKYSNKIVVNDYEIFISHEDPEVDYPYETPVATSEIFPIPCGYSRFGGATTYNYTYENVKVVPLIKPSEYRNKNYPFGGTFNNHSFNFSYNSSLNNDRIIIGNVSYLDTNDEVPDFQEGMVFVVDDTKEGNEKIENMTNASGCIIIDDLLVGPDHYDTTYCNFTTIEIVNTSETEDKIEQIKNTTKNNEYMFVDNVLDRDNLTFTYNITDAPSYPSGDFVWLMKIRKPSKIHNYYTDIGRAKIMSIIFYLVNRIFQKNNFDKWCHGVMLYDPFDTHFMTFGIRGWRWFGFEDRIPFNTWDNSPALPMFTVNYSVGDWMLNESTFEDLPLINGYLDQEYKKQTTTTPGVESYNVVGYQNITKSPQDKIVVISNRYDGWWGETPGDCGLGAGIVLATAKYFNDYDIKPKFNLTFLMTTGEEYGMRGAQYYVDKHPDKNFSLWIGADQLGFRHNNTNLTLTMQNYSYSKNTFNDIITAIADATNYSDRIKNRDDGYNETYGINLTFTGGVGGTETKVWKEVCDCICFGKDNTGIWNYYQRAGAKYSKGDVQDNIDTHDANVTLELFWNITKYFTVWPDCWFEDISIFNTFDTDDNDDLEDTISVKFYPKSMLPHDLNMANISIWGATSADDFVISKILNFSVLNSKTTKSINITLSENEKPGFFTYKIELYNSTGRINETVGIEGNNINDTYTSGFFFLYPYGSNITVPIITNVSATPDPVGFGFNVTINADVVSEVSTIDKVTINISYPDDTYASFNMTNTVDDTYEYVFTDTWQNGVYDYVIWAKDVNGNESGSSQHTFNVSAEATISVCTIKDSYGNNETVNLTDPPSSSFAVGYELLYDGDVLHIWNNLDHYYFDTDSGIQLTNHYDEYWSHNVLMLGYYNNNEWNLIYRTDELSGFNKEIKSDNETYVNVTLWKNLSYAGYDFRLAIRYHLGLNDNELTVIPYIKNINNEDIPYNLGFAWEIKDIQIDMTEEDDYIEIDETSYYLNEEDLDEIYKNLDDPCFYIREDTDEDESESLYLRWDENLNYKVQVKSRTGQYNSPVTLGIKIGTLDVGQEKSTELFWHDATEVINYFNVYDSIISWATNPAYMADGNTSNYASTTIDRDMEVLNIILESTADKGAISKVEIRAFGKYSGSGYPPHDIVLKTVGGTHYFIPGTTGDWSSWYDITNNPSAPNPWTWTDIDNLVVEVEAATESYTLYCSKVDVRVTYNPNPVISNPYPSSGSKGIMITPVLNITISDPEGDTMNITWLSNSSGSWQVFGTNLSVGNGTYHQTFSNATVNGQWWYWKVNVSDGTNTVTSNVFSFYTGYQSKIENTGSTNFTGYLLMQIEYYNTTNSTWILEQVVVNESTPRTINAGCTLALDTIFNPYNVSTSSFTNGDGTYRVYAAFRDPDGDVLVCDDETLLEDSYQFTVSTS